jgi:hypothetical protein
MITTVTFGSVAWGTLGGVTPGLPPAYRLAEDAGPLFLVAEIEVFRPGATGASRPEAFGVPAFGAASAAAAPIQDNTTLRVSDLGWVTRASDPAGIQPYAPLLTSGVELDRAMQLAPDGAAAAAWGTLRLINGDNDLADIAASGNVDGRRVAVRLGRKQRLSHGYLADPAWADTAQLIEGIGAALALDERELRISLRDAGYWLERPVDGAVYAGTGGLEGTATLAGKRKPRLRGGAAGDPVREVSPELVDPTLGIYQVSDAPGSIVALYERGLAGAIANAGQVADIVATVPAAGTYRWESSARGLFVRLGTFPPAGTITIDATGAFPDGSAPTAAAAIALQVLLQDLAVPAPFVDAGSFAGLAAAAPWTAGFALAAGEAMDGAALVGLLLRSGAARLVPARTGLLRAVLLAPLAAGTVPVASYGPAQIIDCRRLDLVPPLAPPPARIRVGWGRNHTVQTSALAPTLSGARIQELAEPYRVAVASSAAVAAAWRRPSDPPPVETLLTNGTNAASLASLLLDVWGVPAGRSLWAVTLPLPYALRHDIGEPIVVAYPGPLRVGALGRIVGEQLRTADNLATLQVLV